MGIEKPGFLQKDAFDAVDVLKNPVSWIGLRKSCLGKTSLKLHVSIAI